MLKEILNYAFLGVWQFLGVALILTIVCNTAMTIIELVLKYLSIIIRGQPIVNNNYFTEIEKDGKEKD